jgi:hypothetical protein
MNPNDDRVVLALGWSINVERLPLGLRHGVGKVTVDLGFGGEEWGGEEKEDEGGVFHGEVPCRDFSTGAMNQPVTLLHP